MSNDEGQEDPQCHELFTRWNVEPQETISLQQFTQVLKDQDHFLHENPKMVKELFAMMDKDQDNKLSLKDLQRYWAVTEPQIRKGFEVLDSDHDGKLVQRDLQRYLEQDLNLDPTRPVLARFFHNLDNKNDGYITYDEFRDFLLFMPRYNGSRIKTLFQLIDTDYTNSEGDVTVIDDFLKGFRYFLSGGLSGVVSRTTTLPFDRVKVFLIARTDLTSPYLADQSKKNLKSPIVKALTSLYRQGGIRAFYVGNGLNVLKVFPESAMKFGSFELAKRFFCSIENVQDQSELSSLATYVSGGFGGVVSQITVYPIDTLKYRVQCLQLDSSVKGFDLLLKTARQMYLEGGLHIFYRGLIAGVTGIFPYLALDLGTFSNIKKWYIKREAKLQGKQEDDIRLPNHVVLSMGAVSGTFGASMVYPINLIRTRLQLQGTFAHPHVYNGFFDCMQRTVRREGLPGLYKGLTPNLLKVAPLVSISYLCYENLKLIFKLE